MLVYPPDAETGVYLLLGELRPYLPFDLSIESFEISPHSMGYAHSKYIDAIGYWLRDGQWERISIELKLYSSGMLRDLSRHPGLSVDLLVCWQDDAKGEIAQSVGHVLALDEVLANVPERERLSIIQYPEASATGGHSPSTTEAVLSRFTESNRPKVERLCQGWLQYHPGASELIFTYGNRTLFRAACYSSQHLIVTEDVDQERRARLVDGLRGDWYEAGAVRIQLDRISVEEVDHFLSVVAQ